MSGVHESPTKPLAALGEGGSNLVFILGSPRSGTSWLQRLLGAHPEVVTSQETSLFSAYCAPLLKAWRDQLQLGTANVGGGRQVGLPTVLTSEEFLELVTAFVTGVYRKTFALKPTARIALDKTPEHSLHVPDIRALFPSAAFLHIVRDGRDVVDSITAAGKSWGHRWAPRSVRDAAKTWRMHVEGARSAAGCERYLEIRYEDLLSDTDAALARCFAFLGLETTADERALFIAHSEARPGRHSPVQESIVWSGELARHHIGGLAEPEGFFRAGVAGGWQHSWSVDDALAFDAVAGDLLSQIGYEEDPRMIASTLRRRRARLVSAMAARAASLGWRMHMMLGRRGLYVQAMRIPPYPPARRSDRTARKSRDADSR